MCKIILKVNIVEAFYNTEFYYINTNIFNLLNFSSGLGEMSYEINSSYF